MLHRPDSLRNAFRSARHGLQLSMLLSLTGCHSCIGSPVEFRVEFTSLSSKTVPGAIEDDGDVKDVKLSDRASFKPSKGAAAGIDKRLRMKSSRDAGAACFLSERKVTGDASSRVRVAFDSTKGLVDGVSTAFLERRPEPAGENPVLRVEAVYDAALDRFITRYLENGEQIGNTFEMPPGSHDVHLYLPDLGASIAGQAAEATGPELTDIGANATLGDHAQDGSDDSALIAIGSFGLGKGGTFYFDQFVLDSNDDASVGAAEFDIAGELASAFLKVDSAAGQLDAGGMINVLTVDTLLTGAYLRVAAAETMLTDAITAGTLDPGTDPEAVHKSHWKALSALVSGSNKTYDLLQAGMTSLDISKLKSVVHETDAAHDALMVAIAQVNGFKGKTVKALDKAMSFSIR